MVLPSPATNGPFFFAWVESGAYFVPDIHAIEDEDVFAFEVSQEEGEYATLEIKIRNPRIGLLSATRKQWAWLSWYNGSEIVPLFFGRLVGIPDSINQEIVTLMFQARPADFVDQKTAYAESLKVFPFYDPIWIATDKLDDTDTVLEAYTSLWHVDRVTHLVTVSDILTPEDGTVEFLESDVPFDSVKINIGTPPLSRVQVTGTVFWSQAHSGAIDLGSRVIETYTGASLINDWPQTGQSLDGGWYVFEGSATDLNKVADVKVSSFSSSWQNNAKSHANGDTMSTSTSSSVPVFTGPSLSCVLTSSTESGLIDPGDSLSEFWGDSDPINRGLKVESSTFYVGMSRVKTVLSLGYAAERPRTETVEFTLALNAQPLITLPDESDTMLLNLSSVDVGLPLVLNVDSPTEFGAIPIDDVRRMSYFPTDRGRKSLEYLIALARAHLLIRSRAINVTFSCPFNMAVDLSCRSGALLHDHRLPGHQATGKVIKYSFGCDGDTGEAIGSVTIGCSIGYGGVIGSSSGTPDYVDDDYVDDDYQTRTDEVVTLATGDVGYSVPTESLSDDGLTFPLDKRQVVISETIHGSLASQVSAIEGSFAADMQVATLSTDTTGTVEAQKALAEANARSTQQIMKTNSIWYELILKPLNGQYAVFYTPTVTLLEAPKMIDLEAAI